MYRLSVCDQLVFYDLASTSWICGKGFKDFQQGISAASTGDVDSDPPMTGWEPNWWSRDVEWGTCSRDLFFAPKLAWDVMCSRSLRHKNEDATSIMDVFFVVSLL